MSGNPPDPKRDGKKRKVWTSLVVSGSLAVSGCASDTTQGAVEGPPPDAALSALKVRYDSWSREARARDSGNKLDIALGFAKGISIFDLAWHGVFLSLES